MSNFFVISSMKKNLQLFIHKLLNASITLQKLNMHNCLYLCIIFRFYVF
jgi:hypothetical protein